MALLDTTDEILDTEELLDTIEDEEDSLLESEEKLLVTTDKLLADLTELLIVDDRILLAARELDAMADLLEELRLFAELASRLLAEALETAGLLLEEGVGLGTRLLATELALLTGAGLPPPPPPPQALNSADITKALSTPRD